MSKLSLNIIFGLALGVIASFLVYAGNPGNMGICAACFLRDVTGALGFHNTPSVQYMRPEIFGIIFGGFISSVIFNEYKGVGASSSFVRFFLGFFAMIGCLIFLGCPWRAFLRLGGGDLSAIMGIFGLFFGVFIGRNFKKRGFSLTSDLTVSTQISFLPILFALIVVIAIFLGFKSSENGPFFASVKGPGSMHASILVSLVASFIIGAVLQRSKFCSVGAFSKIFEKDFSMFAGIVCIVLAATVSNLVLNQYHLGFDKQPIAHNMMIWNFLGMTLAGICFSFAEGCPGKHLMQIGTGNLNSSIFIIGMLAGAAVSHNFTLASSPAGVTQNGIYAIFIGLAFCIFVGLFNKKSI